MERSPFAYNIAILDFLPFSRVFCLFCFVFIFFSLLLLSFSEVSFTYNNIDQLKKKQSGADQSPPENCDSLLNTLTFIRIGRKRYSRVYAVYEIRSSSHCFALTKLSWLNRMMARLCNHAINQRSQTWS